MHFFLSKCFERIVRKISMSFNRFDVLGELIEFVSFSNEVARGQDEAAHLFEFSSQAKEAESLQHVFWIIGPQAKDARVDSFVTSMTLKSLQRGYMNPRDNLFFTTLVGFDLASQDLGAKEAKLLTTIERWLARIQPKCVITLKRGESTLRCHKMTDPIHDKLAEISDKNLLSTEILSEKEKAITLYDRILDILLSKEVSILELGLDSVQRSFEECSQSEWKLSSGPALRWMIESLPFKMTVAPELPVLEVIPPLEIPAEFNL